MVPEQVKAYFTPEGKIEPVEFTATDAEGSLVHIKIARVLREWHEESESMRIFECESVLHKIYILAFSTETNMWEIQTNTPTPKAD